MRTQVRGRPPPQPFVKQKRPPTTNVIVAPPPVIKPKRLGKKSKRVPQYGPYFNGIIVGGDPLLANRYEKLLGEYGIYTHKKVTREENIREYTPPAKTEFVLLLRDNTIRKYDRKHFKHRARAQGCFVAEALHHDDIRHILDKENFKAKALNLAQYTEPDTPPTVLANVEPPEAPTAATEAPEAPEAPTATEPPPSAETTDDAVLKASSDLAHIRKNVDRLVELDDLEKAKSVVGSLVKRLRIERGLSVPEVSTRSGLSTATLYKIESGAVATAHENLIALERAFGIPGGSLPRLPTWRDSRVALMAIGKTPAPKPIASPPTSAPAPAPAPPPPKPEVVETPPPPLPQQQQSRPEAPSTPRPEAPSTPSLSSKEDLSADERFHLDLYELKAQLKARGVKSVRVSLYGIEIAYIEDYHK